MLTDIQRAMLGDHEAATRLTEQGVLIPCPFCGNAFPMKDESNLYGFRIRCPMCETTFSRDYYGTGRGELGQKRTIEAWNTRAPIPSAEEIERLEAKP